MNFNPNPLFYKMIEIYKNNHSKDNKVIICNEGGSRSSKTFDFFHFLVMYCENNKGAGNEIYILRDTLTNCRDYTLKDFVNCMNIIGIDTSKLITSPKPYFNLYGNHIYFRGLDDEKNTEGYPSDILFINEALETSKTKVDGLKMRCRKLIVMDWNPKYTEHWCFDLEGQPNVFFTHSNYKNNKHLQQSVVQEIESYCPWNFEDLHLPESERRPNEENIKNKTANKVRWLVYGEGIRASFEGLVFPNVTYIDSFPQVEREFYGLDFGYTNDPSALVKVGINGKNIYLQKLLYQPTNNALILFNLIKDKITTRVWCDSADPGMVGDLQQLGLQAHGAKKWPGCIKYRVDLINRYNIHIVRDSDFEKEQKNYFYREINGIKTNEPDPNSKYCHLWDATGYACQHELR